MSGAAKQPAVRATRSASELGAVFFALWIVLIGLYPLDLAVGVFTAAAATWASLRLLPPGSHRLRFAALPGLAFRFVRQSVVAGVDVARRAFAPRLPLKPGLVVYPTRYPRGPARHAFASLTALLAGAVPCRDHEPGQRWPC